MHAQCISPPLTDDVTSTSMCLQYADVRFCTISPPSSSLSTLLFLPDLPFYFFFFFCSLRFCCDECDSSDPGCSGCQATSPGIRFLQAYDTGTRQCCPYSIENLMVGLSTIFSVSLFLTIFGCLQTTYQIYVLMHTNTEDQGLRGKKKR